MYISRKETPKFTVTEIPFEDFIRNDNINSFLYTAIYSEHNGIKKYFFIKDNQFFKVKMNESDMSRLDKIYTEEARKNRIPVPLGIPHVHDLNLSQIMFLYEFIEKEHENSFCTEDLKNEKGEVISEVNNYVGTFNGGLPNGLFGFPLTKKETLKLIRNVIAIENEIRRRKLTDFETVKYIYDCFKTSTDYWYPLNYYQNMNISNLISDRRRTANHPFDKFGLIVDKYATCQGLSEGLNELFNYFGIESYTIRNNSHGAVKIMFQDGNRKKASYIDLAAEISPNWKDSRYDKYNNLRSTKIKCNNPNQYNFFLKANWGVNSKPNNETGEVINITDNYGRIIVNNLEQRPLYSHKITILKNYKTRMLKNGEEVQEIFNNEYTITIKGNPKRERHSSEVQVFTHDRKGYLGKGYLIEDLKYSILIWPIPTKKVTLASDKYLISVEPIEGKDRVGGFDSLSDKNTHIVMDKNFKFTIVSTRKKNFGENNLETDEIRNER